jgi:hypothetical protein
MNLTGALAVNFSKREELMQEVEVTFYEVALTANVLEAAERHLGPSNWDFEGAAERSSRAIGDTELTVEEMRELIGDMRADLPGALEPLHRYMQDPQATRATIMLGFMLHGRNTSN